MVKSEEDEVKRTAQRSVRKVRKVAPGGAGCSRGRCSVTQIRAYFYSGGAAKSLTEFSHVSWHHMILRERRGLCNRILKEGRAWARARVR